MIFFALCYFIGYKIKVYGLSFFEGVFPTRVGIEMLQSRHLNTLLVFPTRVGIETSIYNCMKGGFNRLSSFCE